MEGLDIYSTMLMIGAGALMLTSWFMRDEEEAPSEMWEILVPASSKDKEFTYDHHKLWDEYVIDISGGITVMRTVKGEWVSQNNVRFKDRMIPVRVKCNEKDMKKIIDFTIRHYDQEAVLAYRLSDAVILKERETI